MLQEKPTTQWRFGLPFGKDATPKNFYQYGTSLCHYGQFEMALIQFERALELAPGLLEAHEMRGSLLAQLGKTEEGLQELNYVIQERPTSEFVYNSRGIVYLNTNRYDEALADFNKSIALNPAFGPAYYNRALVFQRLAQVNAAIQDLQTAATLEPYCNSSAIVDIQKGIEALQAQQHQQTGQPVEIPQAASQVQTKKTGLLSQVRNWFSRS